MGYKTIEWNGKQITEPGIYSGIPLHLYHDPRICAGDRPWHDGSMRYGPSISSSGLREIFGENKSEKHFYANWRGNPNYREIDEEKKRHFVIGRAVHHLVLGERNFAKLFVQQPHEWPDENGEVKPWHNGRKTCKAWNAARKREGRAWLSLKEIEMIKQMVISVGNHPLVQQGALNGATERSIFWKDRETGIWLKCRPDCIPSDSGDFVDLKTTRTTFWSQLQKTMREYAYYRQAALAQEACREVLGIEWESFTLIFVEKAEPWHTRDVRPHDEDLHRGQRANRAALRRFARALETGIWPGPGDGNEGNERLPLSEQGRETMDTMLKYEGLADGED